MKLINVLDGTEYISNVNPEIFDKIKVEDIAYDSRKACENGIFVAIKGETVDGHKFIQSAYDNGCRIFVVNDNIDLPDGSIKLIVDDSRKMLSRISANFFGNPSKKLKVIGVTGTKGKTTITNYLKKVLCDSGLNTGVIGTNGIFYNDISEKTVNTTPESYELHKTIRKMVDSGVECVAMEVSSGGLMMDRVDDIDFDIGVYTNLSPDHIGPKEHPTFEHYRATKARLFELCKYGIINLDDENSGYMIENATCKINTFSIHKNSDLKASNIELTRCEKGLGSSFCYEYEGHKKQCKILSPGEFSIYNALAVILTGEILGIDEDKITKALSTAQVDGRVEVLPVLPDVTVVLDYAHNGMSLENVLTTLMKYDHNRIISVFGSVGGRTAIRRKELGDVAAKYCDIAILTTDNPDDEDPAKIIDDITESFVDSKCEVIKIVDRAMAMQKAFEISEKGDIVLIAGKGHEKYQYINGERVFFDEKQEAIDAAKRAIEK